MQTCGGIKRCTLQTRNENGFAKQEWRGEEGKKRMGSKIIDVIIIFQKNDSEVVGEWSG